MINAEEFQKEKRKILVNLWHPTGPIDVEHEKVGGFFLVFSRDDGSREGCNVYYSTLVFAESADHAKKVAFEAEYGDATADEGAFKRYCEEMETELMQLRMDKKLEFVEVVAKERTA